MKAKFALFLRILPLAAVLTIPVACTKAPNDAQVSSDVQTRIASDSGLQNKQLTVTAEKGTVTLSGTVDNDAQREAAAKYAASEPGVKQVINNLQVAPMAAASEPAPATAEEASPAPVQRRTSKPSAASRRHARRSSPAAQSQK